MKTNDDMIQYDIDVIEALKDFPKTDVDSVIYLRSRREGTKCNATLYCHSEHEALSAMINASMYKSEKFKYSVLAATKAYLAANTSELVNFVANLQESQNKHKNN